MSYTSCQKCNFRKFVEHLRLSKCARKIEDVMRETVVVALVYLT